MPDIPIYDEKSVPPLRVAPSRIPAALGPGEFADASNIRYPDGGIKVRLGTTALLPLPITGGIPREIWEVALNGTQYIVGAYDFNGTDHGGSPKLFTTFWYSPSPFSTWTEITEAGEGTLLGWSGPYGTSRMQSTSYLDVCVIKRDRFRLGGSWIDGRDQLLIVNGLESNRIWDPLGTTGLQCLVHDPIIVPKNGADFRYAATFNKFHQVATAAITKGYTNSNVTRFKGTNTSTAPYNSGSNYCALLTRLGAAPPAGGETVVIDWAASVTFNRGLVFLLEGINAEAIFSMLKVEISSNNSTYYTVYDPADTTGKYSRSTAAADNSASNPRVFMKYPLDNVDAVNRSFRYVRFTQVGAVSTATDTTVTILMLASEGDIPGTSLWGIAYRDAMSSAESQGFIGRQTLEQISNCGGPATVSASTVSTQFFIQPSPIIYYDYDLFVANSATTATQLVDGGLQGVPNTVDFYLALPGEEEGTHNFSVALYGAGLDSGVTRAWVASFSPAVVKVESDVEYARYSTRLTVYDRDGNRALPSSFNTCIPPCRCCQVANGRLFAGAVRDVQAASYALSDLYFSAYQNHFRFQALQTVDPVTNGLSETCGSRLVFQGQEVRKILASGASADGGSFIFVWTDRHLASLGGSSGSGGPAYTTSQLSQVQELSPYGTNSPQSVVASGLSLFWLAHTHQFVRYNNGVADVIGRFDVDAEFKGIPANRRAEVTADFVNDLLYVGYTPAGESTNTRILIWNEVRRDWMARDIPPKSAERLARLYDYQADGSGQRLFMLHSDGMISAYEEGTTDLDSPQVAIVLKTGEIIAQQLAKDHAGKAIIHQHTVIDADRQTNTVTLTTTYSNGSVRANTLDLTEGYVKDTANNPEPSTPTYGSAGEGRSFNLAITGDMDAGSRIHSIVVQAQAASNIEAGAG